MSCLTESRLGKLDGIKHSSRQGKNQMFSARDKMSAENELKDPVMSGAGAKMERHTPKKREFGLVVEQMVNWTTLFR